MADDLSPDRLRLRPLAPQDAPRLLDLLSDPEVSRWLHSVPHPYTPEDARRYLARDAGRPGVWAVEAGALAGVVSLLPGRGLAYWLGRAYWGRGLMRAAVGTVLAGWFARSTLPVLSGHHPDNTRSRRLLLTVGFQDRDLVEVGSHAGRVAVQRMQLTVQAWSAARPTEAVGT